MSRRRRNVMALSLSAGLVVLVTAACSSASSTSAKSAGSGAAGSPRAASITNVTVAIPALGIDYNWDVLVAKEKGFFQQEGINASLLNFPGPPETIAALASGSAQFAAGVASDASIIAHDKGTNIAIIAGEDDALDELMVKPSITSWSQVKGLSFGSAAPSSGSTLLLQRALQAHGLTLSQVQLRPFGSTADRAAALIAGQVDGASLAQPFDFQAKTKGFRSLATINQILPNYPFTVHDVNTSYAATHPTVVVNYLKAVIKAQAWLADPANRVAAATILSKYSKAALSLSEETWDYVYKTTHGAVQNGAISDMTLQPVLKSAQEESNNTGLKLTGVLDLTYLNRAKS